jgi:hypothetical protein
MLDTTIQPAPPRPPAIRSKGKNPMTDIKISSALNGAAICLAGPVLGILVFFALAA